MDLHDFRIIVLAYMQPYSRPVLISFKNTLVRKVLFLKVLFVKETILTFGQKIRIYFNLESRVLLKLSFLCIG